jgi:hypothetical protein
MGISALRVTIIINYTKVYVCAFGGLIKIYIRPIKIHEINNFKVFYSLKQFSGDVTSLRVFTVFVLAIRVNKLY